MANSEKLIIGITGASGIVFGIKALELLKNTPVETHLIISKAGERTRELETEYSSGDLKALADHVYPSNDIAACISSGSYGSKGMLIAPCSMRSLAEIATGVTSSLLTRAADVVLKERRRLVLMTRETPLNTIHIKNMLAVTEAGGVICPPVPAFYAKPKNLDEMVSYSVARALDLFDIEIPNIKRWEGPRG